MKTVISKDGTKIAYEKSGKGPVLILVGGLFEQRALDSETSQLAAFPLMAKHFTVIHYDRRGRGDSTDTLPYTVDREIEDLEALMKEIGGPVFLSGISSGGVLAMEATLKLGNKVKKLAMYEPPYNFGRIRSDDEETARQVFKDFRKDLKKALDEGRRTDAVGIFMMMLGMPADQIEGMRQYPMWPMFEAVAPTLAYDVALVGEDGSIPTEKAARVAVSTLVMAGEKSYPFMHDTAKTLAKAMPHAQYLVLKGQTHEVKPEALAPALVKFFEA